MKTLCRKDYVTKVPTKPLTRETLDLVFALLLQQVEMDCWSQVVGIPFVSWTQPWRSRVLMGIHRDMERKQGTSLEKFMSGDITVMQVVNFRRIV